MYIFVRQYNSNQISLLKQQVKKCPIINITSEDIQNYEQCVNNYIKNNINMKNIIIIYLHDANIILNNISGLVKNLNDNQNIKYCLGQNFIKNTFSNPSKIYDLVKLKLCKEIIATNYEELTNDTSSWILYMKSLQVNIIFNNLINIKYPIKPKQLLNTMVFNELVEIHLFIDTRAGFIKNCIKSIIDLNYEKKLIDVYIYNNFSRYNWLKEWISSLKLPYNRIIVVNMKHQDTDILKIIMNLPNIGFDSNLTYFEHNLNSTNIPTIFIHGVGLDNTMWEPQKKKIENNQVVFYDLFNHGKSKKKFTKLNFKIFIKQLNDLLNHLSISKCNLIGFSLGALIAQHFSIHNYKKINKLIIIGSVYKRSKQQINNVIIRYKQAIKGKDISLDSVNRWFTKEYLDKNPDIKKKFLNLLEKNKKEDFLPAYKVFLEADKYSLNFNKLLMPTLIMTGENEVGSTPKMSKMLHREIKNSQLFIIPKAKHMAAFEMNNLVNQKIYKFIA